jgi:hypothetical protein
MLQTQTPPPHSGGVCAFTAQKFEEPSAITDPNLEMIRIPKIDITHLEKQTAANRCCIADYYLRFA